MISQRIGLCCPRCRGNLREDGIDRPELVCAECGNVYPVISGIPDLRVFADPYIDMESDRKKGLKLAERFDDFDFAGLVDFYYATTDVVPLKHAQLYKAGLLSAVSRADAALASWEGAATEGAKGPLLEIGCGTAPLLVAAARRNAYPELVGVDIAFRWLVVGKKRLAEAGLNVPLVCACAEALPFGDSMFSRVVFDSVLENTRDQAEALAESARVLVSGGQLFIATPNRFSVGPDPHVGIIAGGYLPKPLLDAYVNRQGGIPPKRKLLSVLALRRKLRAAGFVRTKVFLPDIPAQVRDGRTPLVKRAIDSYHIAKRAPLVRELLYLLGPLLYAVSSRSVRNGDSARAGFVK